MTPRRTPVPKEEMRYPRQLITDYLKRKEPNRSLTHRLKQSEVFQNISNLVDDEEPVGSPLKFVNV